jgi:putative phage-type endonuclease
MTEQRTAEWFKSRRGRITGSVAGALLGLSPWARPQDVIRALVRDWHGAEPEGDPDAPPLVWGRANEDTAKLSLELEHGLEVEPVGFMSHATWLGASPDGLTTLPAHFYGDRFSEPVRAVVEIKTPYGKRNDSAPVFKPLAEQEHYAVQVQLELLCAAVEWAVFYQWAPGGDRIEVVPRDQAALDWMLPRLREMHAKLQEAIANPEMHLGPRLREVATLESDKLVQEYSELQDAIDRAKSRADEIRAQLIELAEGEPSIVGGAKVTPYERAGSLKGTALLKRLKELDPTIDEEAFRGKPSKSWRITL